LTATSDCAIRNVVENGCCALGRGSVAVAAGVDVGAVVGVTLGATVAVAGIVGVAVGTIGIDGLAAQPLTAIKNNTVINKFWCLVIYLTYGRCCFANHS
jgi:hypothetical protein